jgi:hypothetical protein
LAIEDSTFPGSDTLHPANSRSAKHKDSPRFFIAILPDEYITHDCRICLACQ